MKGKWMIFRMLTALLAGLLLLTGCGAVGPADSSELTQGDVESSTDISSQTTDSTDLTSAEKTTTTQGVSTNVSANTSQTTAQTSSSTKKETSATKTSTTTVVDGISGKGYAMYIQRKDDKLKVVQKYAPTRDFVMVIGRLGPNNIYNICTPLAITNTEQTVSDNVDSAVNLVRDLGNSDWLGPHKLTARQNGDGDNTGRGGHVGGSHGYDNTSNMSPENTPVARSVNFRMQIDGKECTGDYAGYANQLHVYWDTYIQAINTVKADGSGREVLHESWHWTFDGTTWDFEVDLNFMEDVYWEQYYGVQCVNWNWNDKIKYGNTDWQELPGNTESKDKLCDTVTTTMNGHYLEMYVDPNYGIGNREYVYGNKPGIFSSNYGGSNTKVYFNLVNGRNFRIAGGTTLKYRGHYKFYYSAG